MKVGITLSAIAALFSVAAFAGHGGQTEETGLDTTATLDVDQDGYISREEAAAHPELSARWAEFDTDQDERLDEDEFSLFEPDPLFESEERKQAIKKTVEERH